MGDIEPCKRVTNSNKFDQFEKHTSAEVLLNCFRQNQKEAESRMWRSCSVLQPFFLSSLFCKVFGCSRYTQEYRWGGHIFHFLPTCKPSCGCAV